MNEQSLAFFIYAMMRGNPGGLGYAQRAAMTEEEMLAVEDFKVAFAPYEQEIRAIAYWQFPNLASLDEIEVTREDYREIVRQIYRGIPFDQVSTETPYRLYTREYPYVQTVIDEIFGRNEKILSVPEKQGRSSGLVVGRVQSGKTRNYIGLILKAIENGWNVIIVLTSNSRSLGTQTRERIKKEFHDFGVNNGSELPFMDRALNGDADRIGNVFSEKSFYWGVAIKSAGELERIKGWFKINNGTLPEMKVMLIDDEADAASPNANKRFHFWDVGEINWHIAKIRSEAEEVQQEIAANPNTRNARYRNGKVIAQWLEYLKSIANTLPDETLASLAECFYNGSSAKKRLENIYTNTDLCRVLSIVNFRTDDGEVIPNLAPYLRSHFDKKQSGKNINLHSRSALVYFIRSIFHIEEESSTINRQIRTIIDSIDYRVQRTYPFARCSYIGYTATPFACLMNALAGETPLYPDFAYPLEKSPYYFGADEIFGSDLENVNPRMDIIRPLATPIVLPNDNEEAENEENPIHEVEQNDADALEIDDIDDDIPELPLDIDQNENFFWDIIASKQKKFWIVENLDDVQRRLGLFIEPHEMTCLLNEQVVNIQETDEAEDADEEDAEEDDEEDGDEGANAGRNGGDDDALPVVVDETVTIRHHHGSLQSLKDAIAWAFCTAAARRCLHHDLQNEHRIPQNGEKEDCWTTMLVNVTEKVNKHQQLQELIQKYLSYWKRREHRPEYIQFCQQVWERETGRFTHQNFLDIFRPAHPENYNDYPDWNVMNSPENDDLNWMLDHHEVIQINSIGEEGQQGQQAYEDARRNGETEEDARQRRLETGEKLWIVCGGNVLSRGLTLAGLTCSYFHRLRKATAIDTFTQMARWFGYRKSYELLPRIWMTDMEFEEYKKIAKLENELHEELINEFKAEIQPGDEESLQEFMYWNRKYSNKAFEMRLLNGFTTAKSTDYLSINAGNVTAIKGIVNNFLNGLENEPGRLDDPACSMFHQYPAWRFISSETICDFLERLMEYYPAKTQRLFQGILSDIQRFNEEQDKLVEQFEGYERETLWWDVVVGTEIDDQNNNCLLWGGHNVTEGNPTPDSVPNEPEVVKYHFIRAPNAFYSVISDYAILKSDLTVLGHMLGLKSKILVRKIKKMQGEAEHLPGNLENLPQGETLEQRIQLFINDVNPYEILRQRRNGERDLVSELLEYLNKTQYEGYRTRHKKDYQKLAYRNSDHDYPVMQIYPVRHKATNQSLIILSFFWPNHEPENFQRAGVGIIEDRATVEEFYETVRDVLEKNDFPLGKTALHRAIVFEALRRRFSKQDFLDHILDTEANNDYYRRINAPGLDEAYYAVSWANSEEEAIQKFNDELFDTARQILWAKAVDKPDDRRIRFEDLFDKVFQTKKFLSLLNHDSRGQREAFHDLLEQRMAGSNIVRTVLQRTEYFEYAGEIEQ